MSEQITKQDAPWGQILSRAVASARTGGQTASKAGNRFVELLMGGNKRIGQVAADVARTNTRREAFRQALFGQNAALGSKIDAVEKAIRGYNGSYADAVNRAAKGGRLAAQAGTAAARAHEVQQFLLSRSGQLGGQLSDLANGSRLQRILNTLPFSKYRGLRKQGGALDAAAERANGLYRSSIQHGVTANALGDAAVADARRIQGLKDKAVGNLAGLKEAEAYLEGFRKVAEAYGVDPQVLLKSAGAIGDLLTGPVYGASSYGNHNGFVNNFVPQLVGGVTGGIGTGIAIGGAPAFGLQGAALGLGTLAGATARNVADHATEGAVTRGLERAGDHVGKWVAGKFGPKAYNPSVFNRTTGRYNRLPTPPNP